MRSLKSKISELLELKLMLSVYQIDEHQSILRLFGNINIKYDNMNSGKTNLKLIENIIVQVPNTASISNGILLHVSKFLEKMVFQLMFEIIQ